MNIQSGRNRRRLACFCFFAVLTAVLVYRLAAYATLSQPPHVYKAVTNSGFSYNSAINRSEFMGDGNWELEYVLDIHDGSEIEVSNVLDRRERYNEMKDIGKMRLKMIGDCPYVDEIESVYYSVDWGKADPFSSSGYLDLDTGLIYWADGVPIIDDYGYRNDVMKHRTVESYLIFNLKNGLYVREYADLRLQRKPVFSSLEALYD